MHVKGRYLAATSSSNPDGTSRRQPVSFRWLKEISLWRPKGAFLMQYITFRMLDTSLISRLSKNLSFFFLVCFPTAAPHFPEKQSLSIAFVKHWWKPLTALDRPDLLCHCCLWEAPVTEIAFVSRDCGKQSTHFSLLSSFRVSRSLNVGLINNLTRPARVGVWTLRIGKRARKKYVA